jgi:O-methyltransferase
MVADAWPYLSWRQLTSVRNLWLCWRVCGYTQQNMSGLVNVIELADRVNLAGIPGAFVECGVWRGGCAGIMARLAQPARRTVWLFDSFEGMPEATEQDVGDAAHALARGRKDGRLVAVGTNVAVLEDVQDLIHRKLGVSRAGVEIRQGWFQDTVGRARGEVGPIALLRLDGDWYESTRTCIEALYDQVAEGGFVVIDDYGEFPGCRTAIDQFFATRGLRVTLHAVDYTRVYLQKPRAISSRPD